MRVGEVDALPAPAAQLGESPFWHPTERALVWCDIDGRALHRFRPHDGQHAQWALDSEPGCAAPCADGTWLVALRRGLVRFDPATGATTPLAPAPYDPAHERFNDGRADPQGRLWAGTIYEPRQPAHAALYRWDGQRLQRMAGDVTVSNGLAFSPDGRTLYWSDTTRARVLALDFDGADGTLSRPRVFAQFPPKTPGQDLATYGGRPDGAAVDAEGAYWVAMYEGARVLRLAPDDGRVLAEIRLPVQCPTMPCFGGDDLRTLYVTTARKGRPEAELARQPWAGRVLALRVDVPGLPVHFARA